MRSTKLRSVSRVSVYMAGSVDLKRLKRCKTGLVLLMIAASRTKAHGQRPAIEANVAEQYLQAAANQERAALRLPPLRRDLALVAAARAHALEMVSHGGISHQFAGEPDLAARGAAAGARFSLISENVGESPSAERMHEAWMHSEGHRHNLLDPGVDSVGIAVIARGRQLFAVEDFERSIAEMTLAQQESAVAKVIAADGIAVKESSEAARRVCGDDRLTERQAAFVMRYTTAEIEQLPEQLRSRLSTGRYATAVVAACSAQETSGFSMYRIAVLLYRPSADF